MAENSPNQNSPGADGGWWNVRQTAKYLGMSEAFVRKFIRLRKMPFVKIGSKSVRFSKAELDRWLEGGGL